MDTGFKQRDLIGEFNVSFVMIIFGVSEGKDTDVLTADFASTKNVTGPFDNLVVMLVLHFLKSPNPLISTPYWWDK